MQITKANIQDLDIIHQLTKSCAQELISKGIFQWNEHYPSKEVLKLDIELQQLYKMSFQNEIIGIIVLSDIQDEEYKKVKWLSPTSKNVYVHRLAIHPNFQKRGFTKMLMDYAEAFAQKNNYVSVRLDTFSKNTRNQLFYEKRGYKRLENIFFPKQSEFPFYCYEKCLNV